MHCRATKAVVSNATIWDTLKLLPEDVVPQVYIPWRCPNLLCPLGITLKSVANEARHLVWAISLACHAIIIAEVQAKCGRDANVPLLHAPPPRLRQRGPAGGVLRDASIPQL